MTYQDEAGEIAAEVSAQVLAALAMYAAGKLTAETLTGIVAAYIAAGNSAAAALGDLALTAAVTTQTGTPATPAGITRPATDIDRLTQAAATIRTDLDNSEDFEHALLVAQSRFQRLAAAEVRQAAATAHASALEESPTATGWVRGLEPEACQLCRYWWRNGRVWPIDHPFQHHTGCDCSQLVVTTAQAIKPVRHH